MGLAREMVQYAIDLAKRNGKRAIRLDVLRGNLPAEKMYTSLGSRKYTISQRKTFCIRIPDQGLAYCRLE
jgi:ribosomal protein S18 acetylase RimI-like enzyme